VKQISWLLLVALAAALGYGAWLWRRKWLERKRVAEERLSSFMAQAMPTAPALAQPTAAAAPPPQKHERLLLEAAAKAGEAGEAALSVQLYARLLSRYPETSFGAQARAAVEEQKRKLARP
jgi:hypothetical protein